MLAWYRDNLFRKYGLSDTLRDVAEKAYLFQTSWPFHSTDSFGLAVFLPRSYPPPAEYVHPAWSHVHQPVLAMWGQLDQHVPVGESVAGLKNSLAHARNENWTILILPHANHDLGISDTGAIQSPWRGYAPGALKTMTDWAWSAIDRPSEIDKRKQTGIAPDAGVLSRLTRYESLRWYGNAAVQSALFFLFLISFLASTIAGVRSCLTRLFGRRQSVALPASSRVVSWKRAIGVLNFLILVAFSITVLLVVDQLHPSCPPILLYLPLLGTISTLATVALLITLARTRRDHAWPAATRVRFALDVLCLMLFVPYMHYWRLIGVHF